MSRTTSSRIRPAAALLAALLLVAVGSPPKAVADDAGGVGWSVKTADNEHGTGRANFTYDVEPGDVIDDTMVVANTGTVALPLSVFAADAFTTTSGNIDLVSTGSPSVDAGTWVTPALDTLTLAPGESADIRFTIVVPADAAPGDHPAGLVTSLVGDDPSQVLDVERRLGTRINLRVAGELVPAASVTIVSVDAVPSLNPFAATVLRLSYRVENTGNTRITGSETVAAHTVAGLLGTQQAQPQLPEILPRSSVEIVREIPVTSLGWIGGTLTVAAEGVGLGAGGIAPEAVDFGTVAIPWSLLAVVLIVAAATAAVLVRVRRSVRRRAVSAAEASPSAT